jgi:hypothetical protein
MFEKMVGIARKVKGRSWITFSEREAADMLGIDRKTARDAFKQLEDMGFLVCLQRGDFARKRLASKWRITCFSHDGQPPTKDYERHKVVHAVWKEQLRKDRLKAARRVKGIAFVTPELEIEIRSRLP